MTHQPRGVTLAVGALARVEGEGAMRVRIQDGQVEQVQLQIYEPPRFFEAFLRGRAHTEPPDITARICGICPVAYQMSACQAIEDACGVRVDGPLADLRRLLYCGEWIESHTLHIYLLHAPDFLGFPSAVDMASRERAAVERGLALKKAGNAILELLGGRAIHPINVRVGGFYRTPSRSELAPLADTLREALGWALETARWVAGFDFPDFTHDYPLLALWQPGSYPILDGQARVGAGGALAPVEFAAADFEDQVIEEQAPHSTALHARLADGRTYMTGPEARYTLSHQWLAPLARQAAADAGLGDKCRNPFRSIVVRAVEVVHAIEEALRLIDAYDEPEAPYVPTPPRPGVGYGMTEAPRGLLYHRYEIGEDGTLTAARIIPPTSQNQAAIEDDLRRFVQARSTLPVETLTAQCEQAIRNYDPCISCSAHFLDLTVEQL